MELAVLIGGAVVAVGVVALWLSRNRGVTVVEVAPPGSAAPSVRPPVVVQGSGPVHDLLNAGRKIEAIKRYRELTGVGLKEAKDAVEALERGEGLVMPAPAPVATVSAGAAIDDAELRAHLAADRPIEAIKRYRELTGLGLKESKDAIDALRETRKS
jgi:ribosomal protein L7/L12